MLIKYEEELYIFFYIKRGSWIEIRKILPDTTLIMLERTMCLAIILLLWKYWFQNHWSDGKHKPKVGLYIKVNRQQVNINAYVRCFAIIIVQENKWILFVTLTYLCTDLYFICKNFFIPHYFYLSLLLLPSSGF